MNKKRLKVEPKAKLGSKIKKPLPNLTNLKPAIEYQPVAFDSSAFEQIVLDYNPSTGVDGGWWYNQTEERNWAEKFSFTADTTIIGINIYTPVGPEPGTVHVKILADSGNNPAAFLYQENKEPDDWIFENGLWKVTVFFTAHFNAVANTTYWIGVSGNGFNLGQNTVRFPGDGMIAAFDGSTFTTYANFPGDMMFQLLGPSWVEENEPNNEYGDSGIIIIGENNTFKGEVHKPGDYSDLWYIKEGASGPLTIENKSPDNVWMDVSSFSNNWGGPGNMYKHIVRLRPGYSGQVTLQSDRYYVINVYVPWRSSGGAYEFEISGTWS